jgi:hypothetical protein
LLVFPNFDMLETNGESSRFHAGTIHASVSPVSGFSAH